MGGIAGKGGPLRRGDVIGSNPVEAIHLIVYSDYL